MARSRRAGCVFLSLVAVAAFVGCSPHASRSDEPSREDSAPESTASESTPSRVDLTAARDAAVRAVRAAYDARNVLTCPGLGIAMSCGNGRCEPLLGESEERCPADCRDHRIGSYNDLPICERYMAVRTPETTAQVRAMVRDAVARGQRIRVVGARHSASGAICGDGVALSTEKLSDVERTVIRGGIAEVLPGVVMKPLTDYLYERGYSLGYTSLGFNGVTVAGAVGTAAHGSSPTHNNTLSHRVAFLDVVGPDGEEKRYDRASTSDVVFRALVANLGLLGVITKVGLHLDPAIRVDTEVKTLDEDALFIGAGALSLVRDCDWAQMNWFLGQRKIVHWCARETSAPATPGAHNTLLDPGVPAALAPIAKGAFHLGTCNGSVSCSLEAVRYLGLELAPPLVKKNAWGQDEHVRRAVGPVAEMTSAALIDLGENVYFQMDWEVAVPQKHIDAVLRLARSHLHDRGVCLPGVGVFLRFGLVEEGGWLTYHGAGGDFVPGETALFFETPVTVPAGYPKARLDAYLGPFRELFFELIRTYGARAHWGKNLDEVFRYQVDVGTYGASLAKFNDAVAQLDPYGVFANEYAKRIGVRWPREGEDFSAAYAANRCGCSVDAAPVCDRRTRRDYANACRARCEGAAAVDLLPDPCDRYRFVDIPLTDRVAAYRGSSVVPVATWRR